LLVPGALVSYLAPSMGIFTCVLADHNEKDQTLIGQFIHMQGWPYARMTFLSPDESLATSRVAVLLDYMVVLAGERGAFRLLADVDESAEAFEGLRQGGFAVYTRQRIWRLSSQSPCKLTLEGWRAARKKDAMAIRALYNNLVPGLVQQAEPFVAQRPQGMVYYRNGELLAYIELRYGGRGIWVQPFIHPDAPDVPDQLFDILQTVPERRTRPVYICIRSYQAWLEPAIEKMKAEAGPRQAVMVRQMAIQQKATRTLPIPNLEGGQAKVSTPIVNLENK